MNEMGSRFTKDFSMCLFSQFSFSHLPKHHYLDTHCKFLSAKSLSSLFCLFVCQSHAKTVCESKPAPSYCPHGAAFLSEAGDSRPAMPNPSPARTPFSRAPSTLRTHRLIQEPWSFSAWTRRRQQQKQKQNNRRETTDFCRNQQKGAKRHR